MKNIIEELDLGDFFITYLVRSRIAISCGAAAEGGEGASLVQRLLAEPGGLGLFPGPGGLGPVPGLEAPRLPGLEALVKGPRLLKVPDGQMFIRYE